MYVGGILISQIWLLLPLGLLCTTFAHTQAANLCRRLPWKGPWCDSFLTRLLYIYLRIFLHELYISPVPFALAACVCFLTHGTAFYTSLLQYTLTKAHEQNVTPVQFMAYSAKFMLTKQATATARKTGSRCLLKPAMNSCTATG